MTIISRFLQMSDLALTLPAYACMLSNITIVDVSLLHIKGVEEVFEDYAANSTTVPIQVEKCRYIYIY